MSNQLQTETISKHKLSDALRQKMILLLNQQLADTLDLHSQVKQAHWNVKGIHFMQLHLLFDELAESLLEYSDLLAERVVTLGGVANGTVRMSSTQSSLPELPADVHEGKLMLELLVERYSSYSALSRIGIDTASSDQVTSDIFTEISRTTDKHLWFLSAHLQ